MLCPGVSFSCDKLRFGESEFCFEWQEDCNLPQDSKEHDRDDGWQPITCYSKHPLGCRGRVYISILERPIAHVRVRVRRTCFPNLPRCKLECSERKRMLSGNALRWACLRGAGPACMARHILPEGAGTHILFHLSFRVGAEKCSPSSRLLLSWQHAIAMPLRLRPKGPLDLGIMHVVRTGTDQKHLLAWSVKIKRRKHELTRLPILWHASATQQQRGGGGSSADSVLLA